MVQESLKHQQASSGLDAIRNRDLQTSAIEAIAASDLDLAEPLVNGTSSGSATTKKSEEELRADSEKVKAYVAEAWEYTGNLAPRTPPRGGFDLLDLRRNW